jgi:hypothetical protein
LRPSSFQRVARYGRKAVNQPFLKQHLGVAKMLANPGQ